MMRSKPPFRADVVGSILRTAPLKEARAKREKGEITRGAAHRGRRPRDREDHQEAGRGRAEARDRRRIPPLLVAFRFLRHARRRRDPRDRSRHPIPGRADAAPDPAHHRQARFHHSPDAGAFQVSQGAYPRHAENVHPEPGDAAFPARAERGRHEVLCRPQRHFRRSGENLSAGDPRLLRRRLPLSAIRRHRLGLSVLAGRAEKGARPRARRRPLAAGLCPRHQHGARRQAGRHGGDDACLPRQFPLDLDFRGRLRAGRRDHARQAELRRLFPRIRHARAPAASSRCAFCPKATRSSCSASSPPSPARWKRKTTSSAASRKRPNLPRSISSRCRRNAALPRPKKAMCSPRKSNGRSCAWSSNLANEVWG